MKRPRKNEKYKSRYKYSPRRSTMESIETFDGETIEQRVRKLLANNEPIKDGAPEIFTERKDGVQPQYNIRTDRWELATEAMDLISKQTIAKRDGVIPLNPDKKDDGGPESIDGEITKEK